MPLLHSYAAIATARRWARESLNHPEPPAATLLARTLSHPGGLRFTLDFVDGVLRPEDPGVGASALRELSTRPAGFLPMPLQLGLRAAGMAPALALPAARRAFEALVGDLVVDVGRSLGPTLNRLRRYGADLNVNLLGEAVLGDGHAQRRLAATMGLLERPEVDYVSVKVSAVLGPHAPFGHGAAVERAMERLRPLLLTAAGLGKFVNLDMEEYRDLHLTLDVVERLLLEDRLLGLRAGVAVQTYLKESHLVLRRLDEFAAARGSRGGEPIKVRLVKGANLAMERVQAELRGWDDPVLPTKADTDASFLEALDFCLRPGRADRMRVGVASHNVFSLAAAWELARERGVADAMDVEMLSGMGVPLQRVLQQEIGRLRLYVPVVPRREFDSAIAYLVRRLEENAAPENFMSGAHALGSDAAFLDREEARFRAAAARAPLSRPDDWATQHRSLRDPGEPDPGFANAVDTNPALRHNQVWADRIRARLPEPELGSHRVHAAAIGTHAEVDDVLDRGRIAGEAWAAVPAERRAEALRRLAGEIERLRTDFVTVAADEVGKLIDQSDVEVSEACDFAAYYAERALDPHPGVVAVPPRLTVVAPPWNFPIAIPLGGVAAALAAGSAVVLKPAPPARRTAALLHEACRRAGLPADLVQFVVVDDGPVGRRLIDDDRVDTVILTGAAETAELFRSWRPDLRLFAETSGKNAIVVTPSADLDQAVADVVSSAFGHAGQKCSASSLAILVGSVARSERFRQQLVDAVSSLHVAWPDDPAAQVGPLTEPPGEKLQRGLGTPEPGQSWLVEPRRIDERLWRPGIRVGVQPGSDCHQTEYFGPVLGLMSARDLDEAIEWQNGTVYGLTAGLHSLDRGEIAHWLDRVEAGNCYVNRSITGAIVRRQPFGGWKRSAVGPGAKAGGPNYVASLVDWVAESPAGCALPTREDAVEFLDRHDPSALTAEINVLRYLPAPVTVRVEDASPGDVRHEAMAALLVGSRPRFSFRQLPEGPLAGALASAGCSVAVESDEVFDQAASGRIRHLGSRSLNGALQGSIDATVYGGMPVPGRLAFLPYVREQAVSITNHRYGHPVDQVLF
ncbi:proline dehydrogenase family protein [Tessaracoccus flavus]|uniref:L-glutamate gamma-semialdehyde dehydrogenase n=1 Tax=Tessaracoccus flavus TaxID=1610493 RepID=A0A1Q2CDN7_9ACTN|nr:proline dehydrogenase family protein [Tessaracoccus flavus]AQP44190.1 hypothetical protein RPIT_04635 [Tessaracoccus flavus]SDY37704.1 L-proline dehydrogenase [Tessaracoccus flavus]